MNDDILMIGGGGHAYVLLDILNILKIKVHGYISPEKSTLNLEYLGDDSYLTPNQCNKFKLINAIGSIVIPHKRKHVFLYYKNMGFRFKTVVHPNATISRSAQILEGAQIMAGVILQPGVIIKPNTIINTRATIDHHSIIKEHTHVAPGTTICGNVTIGDLCHIGPNSTIIQGVTIKNETFIPAHTLVKENI
jgi:sugar O-acyltransferase (sialic acid O-acetyltransferase NeuD family)